MTEYALIDPNDAIAALSTAVDPTVETKTGWRWLPVLRTTDTSGGSAVFSETITVLDAEVRIVRVGRALTPAELAARYDAAVTPLDGVESLMRAVVLVIIDELNRHSAVETGILAASRNATSLATFQAGTNAITPIPNRSTADLRTAIRNKLGT